LRQGAETAIMGKVFNISLAAFAAIGSFLFGYDSGVMTDVIASPDFLEFFDTEPTSPIIGAINATFSGGAVFGALFGGVIMDKYGRKGTIFVGAVIASVGAVLQCAAYQYVLINPLPPLLGEPCCRFHLSDFDLFP
jgi:MFS family permease